MTFAEWILTQGQQKFLQWLIKQESPVTVQAILSRYPDYGAFYIDVLHDFGFIIQTDDEVAVRWEVFFDEQWWKAHGMF